MLYEAPLESKKLNIIKCTRITLKYNSSNIPENLQNFPTKSVLTANNQLEAFQIFYEI